MAGRGMHAVCIQSQYILCDCCIYWLFLNSFALADTDAAGQTITASFDEHEVASENFNSRLHTTLTTLIYSSLKPQTSTYMYIYESKFSPMKRTLRLCTTLALCLSLALSHHTDYLFCACQTDDPKQSIYQLLYNLHPQQLCSNTVCAAAYHHMYVLLTVDSLLN